MPVRVRVSAKVNLHLAVGARRPDGYHELVTVFHAVDLCDEVVATPADGIELAVDAAGVPADERNLAWRAAVALARHGVIEPNVRLEIIKAIPVAGGMAGGSADAAATLVACDALWHTGASRDDLFGLAAGLGSDVPFALLGGTALGTGRGERLAPVAASAPLHWVFALADHGISTATAYHEFDELRRTPAPPPDALLDALRDGDPKAIAASLHNDLQPVALALAPDLRATLDAGRDLGALAGIVSGSGPTCAFLATDAADADRLAAALAEQGVATKVASGPAAGATVLH